MVCISPPGIKSTQRDSARYIRLAKPPRSTISPIRINSGMATRLTLVLVSQARLPIMFHTGLSENRLSSSSASEPKAPATYIPAKNITAIRMNAIAISIGHQRRFAGRLARLPWPRQPKAISGRSPGATPHFERNDALSRALNRLKAQSPIRASAGRIPGRAVCGPGRHHRVWQASFVIPAEPA